MQAHIHTTHMSRRVTSRHVTSHHIKSQHISPGENKCNQPRITSVQIAYHTSSVPKPSHHGRLHGARDHDPRLQGEHAVPPPASIAVDRGIECTPEGDGTYRGQREGRRRGRNRRCEYSGDTDRRTLVKYSVKHSYGERQTDR